MTETQRERVYQLFGDLSELEPSQWEAVLSGVDDAEVRAEVESLLQHMAPLAKGLHTSIGQMMHGAATAGAFGDRTVEPGTRFERYRILRRIGQGGMGDVYEAVRENDFHKRVALKIVRYGLDSEFARGRFQLERQTLAGLEHPFIARLLDGGEAENGSPYLVLEFVDGVPIDSYCEGRPREDILKLFLKVCEAVEYAHRNLVIHRDLKPANIMVTEDGDPKLLDFGIAKLLKPGESVTLAMQVALTPQYASPEQVRGGTITTASDVYSLGVILYQLLTRRKPYELATTTPLEMERIVCLEPPAPPRLGDELDDILMMALRKEPERRYASVLLLAQDIERYRDGRPVTATRDSALYRTRKYVRRHWIGLASAAVVVLAVCAGAGVASYQAYIAKQRLAQVRKLANTFLFDFHDQIVNVAGTTKARAFVVKTAQEYLADLSKSAGSDPELQAELAQAYQRMGDAQGKPRTPNLGDAAGAEASYRHAADLYGSLAKRNPKYAANAAQSLNVLAFFYLNALRLDEAQKTLAEAFTLADALKRDGSSYALSVLIHLHQTRGDLAELDSTKGDDVSDNLLALEYTQRWVGLPPLPTPAESDHMLGRAQLRLGRAYFEHAQLDKAQSYLMAARATVMGAYSREPQNASFRSLLIAADVSLGGLYTSGIEPSLHQPAAGFSAMQEAVSMMSPLIAADPNDLVTRVREMDAFLVEGQSLFQQDRRAGLAETRRALAIRKELTDGKPFPPGYRDELNSMQLAVPVLSRLGAPGEAYAFAMHNIADRRQILGDLAPTDDDNWFLIRDMQVAADAARAEGNEAEAGRLLQEALGRAGPIAGSADQSPWKAIVASSFYDALERQAVATGRCDEAMAWRQKEAAVWRHLATSLEYAAGRLKMVETAPAPCSRSAAKNLSSQ